MKLATLFLLFSPILALPTPDEAADSASAGPQAAGLTKTVNGGYTIRCKSPALFALCTAENAAARCDVTGFHCNFMVSCEKNCWCE